MTALALGVHYAHIARSAPSTSTIRSHRHTATGLPGERERSERHQPWAKKVPREKHWKRVDVSAAHGARRGSRV